MQTVVLIAGEQHEVSAAELYNSFGTGRRGGWLLNASCDFLRPGATVSALMPLNNGHSTLLLGRISSCVPGSRLTIVHDQPWRGRLHLRFADNLDGGSTLRVSAELDDAGLAWWMEQRGWRSEVEADPDAHRIGLLTSKTGPGSVFAIACEYLARLAVDHINADGGIGGRRVELDIHDDATDPGRAAVEAQYMVRSGCRAIVASVTSASFEAVRRGVRPATLPLIHPVLNEGGPGEPHVFRWGERPLAQVRTAAPLMRRAGGSTRWFHIGNDYSWSRGAHLAGVRAIEETGGSVVQHAFTPLGSTEFSTLIDCIRASGVGSILSSLVGADEVAFQRQLWDSGMREECDVLSLVMDESTLERIGAAASTGIWGAFGYFNSLDSRDNLMLRQQYADAYGPWAPPISSFSEAVYEAVLLYAAAARSREADVLRGLRRLSLDLPRGRVELNGPQVMRQQMHVSQASPAGYRLVSR